jgi:hypothetical protein
MVIIRVQTTHLARKPRRNQCDVAGDVRALNRS